MAAKTVFERSLGIWEGTYRVLDRDGKVLDQHQSRLEIFADGARRGSRNIYTWADGRTVTFKFSGEYRDGRTYLESDRIKGFMEEVADDCIVLT